MDSSLLFSVLPLADIGPFPPDVYFPTTGEAWRWLPVGFAFNLIVETPVFLLGLSRAHPWRRRVAASVWVNACSYPVVAVALPLLLGLEPRGRYLAVAETFAPLSECVLFALAWHAAGTAGRDRWRDFTAITAANLTSFLLGEFLNGHNWFGWLDWLGR